MGTARQEFERLTGTGQLRVECGQVFGRPPDAFGGPPAWDRVEGMLLGLAIGDALGNTTEGLLSAQRRARYGAIRHYLPNPHAQGQCVGLPSDDTQLAFWTLEQLLESERPDPEALLRRFAARPIYGIGATVRKALARHRQGEPWHGCGVQSAGNGALMRIAPVLVPHLRAATTDLWVDVALCAAATHNDPSSTSACLALVDILWRLLRMDPPVRPEWWLERYAAVARDVEGPAQLTARSPSFPEYRGPLWEFVARYVPVAWGDGRTVASAGDWWYSGAYLLETVPTALYVLMRHSDDPELALALAATDTKDNDTVGAIVGAAVGALHGAEALPARWRLGLLGRTGASDDGRVFELIAAAGRRWG